MYADIRNVGFLWESTLKDEPEERGCRRTGKKLGNLGRTEKPDDFTHCRITYFQFNLPSSFPSTDDRTENHYSSPAGWGGIEKRKRRKKGKEWCMLEEEEQRDERKGRRSCWRFAWRDSKTKQKKWRVNRIKKKKKGFLRVSPKERLALWYCRGRPDHEILLVIPNPPYANSRVQSSTDNRTGYVVDLAGNIYDRFHTPFILDLYFACSPFLATIVLF